MRVGDCFVPKSEMVTTLPEKLTRFMRNRKAARESRVMTHFTFASILIADDFSGWRARVREILAAHPEWKIISEVSDEREAVEEASELQPDL